MGRVFDDGRLRGRTSLATDIFRDTPSGMREGAFGARAFGGRMPSAVRGTRFPTAEVSVVMNVECASAACKRPVGTSALGLLERNFWPGDRDRVVCHCVETLVGSVGGIECGCIGSGTEIESGN
ncbi:hypothetical protein AXG93_2752s1240 [Marchantia polymorpha subsp. ruderalis]|uniref:Uncharacterized protein n=1 Tax=Marchantia polymorpha subsp. ruderalis TaxID=1480154 RepID=A0A176VTG8_MARPO|nr:hypothetical protein AXG93_2752s1240 [Marchantia polymorpha subsp. ruderalis]